MNMVQPVPLAAPLGLLENMLWGYEAHRHGNNGDDDSSNGDDDNNGLANNNGFAADNNGNANGLAHDHHAFAANGAAHDNNGAGNQNGV